MDTLTPKQEEIYNIIKENYEEWRIKNVESLAFIYYSFCPFLH